MINNGKMIKSNINTNIFCDIDLSKYTREGMEDFLDGK